MRSADDDGRFTLLVCVRVTEYSVSNFIVAFATPARSLTIVLCESVAKVRLLTTSFLNLTPRPRQAQPVPIKVPKRHVRMVQNNSQFFSF